MARQTSKKKRKKIKRPYKVNRKRHAARRHAHSKRHHGRMLDEARTMSAILQHLLLRQHNKNYHFNPRHFSNDPEYKHSDARTQEFKRGFPALDTDFWRPAAARGVTYAQNFKKPKPRRHPGFMRYST